MNIHEQIQALTELTRYKKEKGVDPERGLEKLAKWTDAPDIGMHFASLDKVGINPRNHYATPMGIYAYLFDREWFDVFRKGDVPFAGGRDFIHLIQLNSGSRKNFIVVQASGRANYGSSRYKRDVETLRKNYESNAKIVAAFNAGWSWRSGGEIRSWLDLVDISAKTALIKTDFGYMWNLTRLIAQIIGLNGPNKIVAWTEALLSLGIEGVIDYGAGIIHENEKRQMVILNPTAFKRVETVTKEEVERSRTSGIADSPEIKRLEEKLESWFVESMKKAKWTLRLQFVYMDASEIEDAAKKYEEILKGWNEFSKEMTSLMDSKGRRRPRHVSPVTPKEHMNRFLKVLQKRFKNHLPVGLHADNVDRVERGLEAAITALKGVRKYESGLEALIKNNDLKGMLEYAKSESIPGADFIFDRQVDQLKKSLGKVSTSILSSMEPASDEEIEAKVGEIEDSIKSVGWPNLGSDAHDEIEYFMSQRKRRANG